jgi:3-methyl-2-oxobutanoate hydroxymethyltransferase
MGHVGLTPQSIHAFGGYKLQGRGDDAERAAADAEAVATAGAFAVVLEKVTEPLARKLTAALSIPTIGIGASSACDGQILVLDDILGTFSAFRPKFAKCYAEIGRDIEKAIAAYAADVRTRRFPAAEHTFADAAVA